MWRLTLWFCLACSLSLNVYLLMTLYIDKVEGSIVSPQDLVITKPTLSDSQLKNSGGMHAGTEEISSTTTKQTSLAVDSQRETPDSVSFDQVKQAIDLKDYIHASFLTNTLVNAAKADNSQKFKLDTTFNEIKRYWLQQTKALIQQSSFIDAELSINAFLEVQRDDVDFLYQQVSLYLQQQLIELAIKHAYEVQYHVFDEVHKQKVFLYARDFAQQQADTLANKSLWLELSELVQETLVLDPDNLNLLWLLIRALYELGELERAKDSIEILIEHPNYQVKARDLLAKIDATLNAPESISLKRQGEHFIVDATINAQVNVSLLLDTGASISLLSERAFDELMQYSEATYLRDIQMNTAGGAIIASLYQVDEVNIQGNVVNDFVFAVSDFASDHNDGLLGMNFLKQFDFYIDQDNSELTLKDK